MDEYESENRISNLPNCHKCADTSDLSGFNFCDKMQCPIAKWLAHYAVVWKIRVQVPPLSLNLVTNAVAICQIIITQPFPEMP